MSNIASSLNADEYEIAAKPLSKSPATKKKFKKHLNDGESTASNYQDLDDEKLSGVYQSFGKTENELHDYIEVISDTPSSSLETDKEPLIIKNKKAQSRQVSKSATNRLLTGSPSDDIYYEPINVRQKDAPKEKKTGALRKILNKQSGSCHPSNRTILLIVFAVLFLTIVSFVLVIFLIFGVIGTQCTCTNKPPTEGKHAWY